MPIIEKPFQINGRIWTCLRNFGFLKDQSSEDTYAGNGRMLRYMFCDADAVRPSGIEKDEYFCNKFCNCML